MLRQQREEEAAQRGRDRTGGRERQQAGCQSKRTKKKKELIRFRDVAARNFQGISVPHLLNVSFGRGGWEKRGEGSGQHFKLIMALFGAFPK